jgi:hypothetical protein
MLQREQEMKLFSLAFTNYESCNFLAALELFDKFLHLNPNDTPAKILKERCQEFIANGVPKNWDGAFSILRK